MATSDLKISLGPIQYYWPRDSVFSFYEAMAATKVDVVYLGETVCSRRHELRLADWLDVAALLQEAGKEVVLSTQVLLESGAEVATMHKIAGNGNYGVEANDMGAVHLLAGKVPFVAGPHLNIYNPQTLALLAGLGAQRWVMPVELSRDSLRALQQHRPAAMATEVFGYGRLPLAFSARCFTARRYNLSKDSCEFRCLDHPDGMLLATREGQPFLAFNGIQTQSAQIYNLIRELDELSQLGVDVLRISPQSAHTVEVVKLFRQCLDRDKTGDDAAREIADLMPAAACNGYWHGRPGLDQVVAPHRAVEA